MVLFWLFLVVFSCFGLFLDVFGCFYVFLDLVGGGFSECPPPSFLK